MTKFITPYCIVCKKNSEVELDPDNLLDWLFRVKPIEKAFPDMSAEDREVLISGTHPECWDTLFPEEDEDVQS